MKKILIAILSVIMLVSVAATLTACGGSKDVGIAMPTSDLQRWNQDGAALKKGFEDKGFSVDLKFSNNAVTTQINDIENMVTQGVKVLVISAIEGTALGRPLEQAKKKGIIVIAYDRLIMNTPDVDYYTSFDNFAVGVAQGKYIEDKLGLKTLEAGQSKNIEFIAGDPGDNNATLFFDGAMSILGDYLKGTSPKLKCLSGQTKFEEVSTAAWSSEKAQTRFDTIKGFYNTSDKKLDAVCASNDSTAQGVTASLKSLYTTKEAFPILTGQDCDKVSVKNMKDGFQSMSVFKDTRTLAKNTVDLVLAVLDGKEQTDLIKDKLLNNDSYHNGIRTVHANISDVVVVTTANIQEMLIDSGYYKASDIA